MKLLGIDYGTTSVKATLFDEKLSELISLKKKNSYYIVIGKSLKTCLKYSL